MLRKQAFLPEKYDENIVATLPYYEEYFKQIRNCPYGFSHTDSMVRHRLRDWKNGRYGD